METCPSLPEESLNGLKLLTLEVHYVLIFFCYITTGVHLLAGSTITNPQIVMP